MSHTACSLQGRREEKYPGSERGGKGSREVSALFLSGANNPRCNTLHLVVVSMTKIKRAGQHLRGHPEEEIKAVRGGT